MTEYQQTIEYLYSQLPMFSTSGAGAYKPGLQTAMMLDRAFGCPHFMYRTIHIAGTNGKGSTSNMLASVLQTAGYKTGLYTSPHIHDFRERIRVDGQMITEAAVVDFVRRYREMHLGCEPSFFELTTIMAFDYFRQQRVDVAVIETGLGGRLDTTNIIMPVLSIITNVSLDHTAQLGDNLASIAYEKAGIIKPVIPVVIGNADGEVRRVFMQAAHKMHSPIRFACDYPVAMDTVDGRDRFATMTKGRPSIVPDLQGDFQRENVNTVMHALDTLSITDTDIINEGLSHTMRNTGLTGRWTTIRERDPHIIIDTGHNSGAWQWLAPALERIASAGPLRIVLGFVADKEIDDIFDRLPADAEYYFVTPSVKRGRKAHDLLEAAGRRGIKGRAYDTVEAGCEEALSEARPGDTVFIGGSNYVIAEIDLKKLEIGGIRQKNNT